MKSAACIAAPFVTVAALAGYAHSPSTVTIMGDKIVLEAEVTGVVNSCWKTNPQIKRLDVLFPLILGEVADEVSSKLGRTTDATKLRATMEADPDASQAFGTPCQKVVEGELRIRYL